MRRITFSFIFCFFALGVLFSGCKSQEASLLTSPENSIATDSKKITNYAIKESLLPKYLELIKSNRLSLKEALQLAKAKNLPKEISNLEDKIAEEKSKNAVKKQLSTLIASYDYIATKNNAKVTQNLSSEKKSLLLNFSLAFFNSFQPSNPSLMRQKRLERATQKLVYNVVVAYFDVAAAQKKVFALKKLWDESYLRNNEGDPESKVRLTVIKKHLLAAVANFRQNCEKLATVTGFENPDELSVDDTYFTNLVDFDVPSINLLEQMALCLRPELYETNLAKEFKLASCRNAIESLFADVRVSHENNEDWNNHFYSRTWNELAYKSAYNLLLLADNQLKVNPRQFTLDEIKLYTRAITVIAQVRISHILWDKVNKEYQVNDKQLQSLKDKARVLLIVNKSSNNQNLAQLDNTLLQASLMESKRFDSISKLYSTYYLLLSNIGIDNLDSRTFSQLQRVIKQKSKEAAQFSAKENSTSVKDVKNSSSSNKQSTNQVNTFGDVDFLNIYQ